MDLTPNDTLCCPPPLFHCFGLTLGLLACLTHGAKIVFPAEQFDPVACMQAIDAERCTALHGVPAMMESIMDVPRPEGWTSDLRTGIVAGSPVPKWLMERMVNELNMSDFTSSYGLTEASPTVFNAHTTDSLHARLTTVGTVLPHARVKIVDHQDRVVPIGVRGELCVAGYQVCRGYWENAEKTAELIVRDEYGEPWLHTGDEAVLDVDGYCTITGRFKDIIIRGMYFPFVSATLETCVLTKSQAAKTSTLSKSKNVSSHTHPSPAPSSSASRTLATLKCPLPSSYTSPTRINQIWPRCRAGCGRCWAGIRRLCKSSGWERTAMSRCR